MTWVYTTNPLYTPSPLISSSLTLRLPPLLLSPQPSSSLQKPQFNERLDRWPPLFAITAFLIIVPPPATLILLLHAIFILFKPSIQWEVHGEWWVQWMQFLPLTPSKPNHLTLSLTPYPSAKFVGYQSFLQC